jgi:glucose-6-phosphate 1-dehydrogenase
VLNLAENPFREGLTVERAAEPCAVVIFGATGDLTRRKLIPALFSLYLQGLSPAKFAIIGFARRPWSDDYFREHMRSAVLEHSSASASNLGAWETFARSLSYVQSSFGDADGYLRLKERIAEFSAANGVPRNAVFYLATPPSEYAAVIGNLGASGLADEDGGWRRIIIEKPVGTDRASARELNSHVRGVFPESRVYRIDHFLGKETVQNILVFRFANSIFEPLWNTKYVDHVQITVAESVGVEGRGAFFDRAGIVRDLMQNHQLQLLTLTAMEPPSSVDADAVRAEKVKVLQAVRPLSGEDLVKSVVRGQYAAGSSQGAHVPGYLDEPDVAPDSGTETFAAARLMVDNWRWAGVPFYLRVGKRLPKKVTEICLQFKAVPGILFGAGHRREMTPNLLVMRIQPDEGISLRFTCKEPGPSMSLQQVRMEFHYGASFGAPSPEAYERLLLDAAIGEQSLFAREDEVDAAWRIVDPMLAHWAEHGREGLSSYRAGAWGPAESLDLLRRDGRRWRRV